MLDFYFAEIRFHDAAKGNETDMSNYNYDHIRKAVDEWRKSNLTRKLKKDAQIELSKDNKNVLIIDLTFKHCLAQIVVTDPGFAPYQYVSFEALALDSEKSRRLGQAEMIYFFYDSPEFMMRDVMSELDNGIRYCSDYVPDLLFKTYRGKKGVLKFLLNEAYKVFHPDDVKKVSAALLGQPFMCVDTFAQYLVVKNDSIVLKVLPGIFCPYLS